MRCCSTMRGAAINMREQGSRRQLRTSLSAGERGMYMMMLLHLPGRVNSGNWQSGLPHGGGSLIWNSETCCMRQPRQCVHAGRCRPAGMLSSYPHVRRVQAGGSVK